MSNSENLIGDMPVKGWVDRLVPGPLLPYAKLMRLDRPIGWWLLMWPCWWSTAMAADASTYYLPDPVLLVLFLIGSVVMRGAGCTYNDLVDRNIDAQVARTAARPIAAGVVSPGQAKIFLVILMLIGLAVLLSLNGFAIILGIISLPLVFAYPFMKRITYWPQAWLGITFTYGALMGWAAVRGELDWAPIVLYIACWFWTLHYDTIYAHQDKEDDLLVGVKSSALALGPNTQPALLLFSTVFIALVAVSGWLAGLHWMFFVWLSLPYVHLLWQVVQVDINNGSDCLAKFKSNRWMGALLFVVIVIGRALAGDGGA
jgi:4-hydroxybenzoate polyprenyltransferase